MAVVDDHPYDDVVPTIDDAMARGAVYVHCWGGIGAGPARSSAACSPTRVSATTR